MNVGVSESGYKAAVKCPTHELDYMHTTDHWASADMSVLLSVQEVLAHSLLYITVFIG